MQTRRSSRTMRPPALLLLVAWSVATENQRGKQAVEAFALRAAIVKTNSWVPTTTAATTTTTTTTRWHGQSRRRSCFERQACTGHARRRRGSDSRLHSALDGREATGRSPESDSCSSLSCEEKLSAVFSWRGARNRRRQALPVLFGEDQGWLEALKGATIEDGLPTASLGPKKVDVERKCCVLVSFCFLHLWTLCFHCM